MSLPPSIFAPIPVMSSMNLCNLKSKEKTQKTQLHTQVKKYIPTRVKVISVDPQVNQKATMSRVSTIHITKNQPFHLNPVSHNLNLFTQVQPKHHSPSLKIKQHIKMTSCIANPFPKNHNHNPNQSLTFSQLISTLTKNLFTLINQSNLHYLRPMFNIKNKFNPACPIVSLNL